MALLLAVAAGCGGETALLIDVDAPDFGPDEIDALRFQIDTPSGRTADVTKAVPGRWPQSLAVGPGRADLGEPVTIRVTGLRSGIARVRRVTRAMFAPGRTVRVQIVLMPACLDVPCPDPFDDCVGGVCIPLEPGIDGGPPPIDAGEDASSFDAGADAGFDAGFDGGDIDAGIDAGSMDAGIDAGPMDAGIDARPDGGCVPAPPEVCGGGDEDCDGTTDEALPCPGSIVISEVRTGNGVTGGALDELVELYNRTGTPIPLTGIRLEYSSGPGGSWLLRHIYPPGAMLPAHGFYLAAGTGYLLATPPDSAAAWSSGFAELGGHVRIISFGVVLDRFGWGTAVMPEGTAFPGAPDGSGSYERKANAAATATSMSTGGADERRGNGHDTDNNAADFIRRTTADPQNTATAPELP